MYAKTALGLAIAAYAANEVSAFHASPSLTSARLRIAPALRPQGAGKRLLNVGGTTKNLRRSAQTLSMVAVEKATPAATADSPTGNVLPNETFDLIVIGGGPAGLTAALTAADVGKSVAIIDGTPKKRVQFSGPTGLFSKALRDSAKKVQVSSLREMGMLDSTIWNQVEALTNSICSASGAQNLGAIESYGIPTVRGTAVLYEDDDPETSKIKVMRADGGEEIATCRKLIVATGSQPMRMANLPYDDVRVFDSDSIRELKFLPKSMVIVGSGIIAIEYAKIFCKLETQVTMVIRGKSFEAALERIGIDNQVASTLKDDLVKSGVEILLDTEIASMSQPGEAKHDPFGEIRGAMTIETKGSQSGEAGKVIEAEVLMTATGRVANTKGLGLEEAGVTLNSGTIEVNGDLETTVPGVYAVGDVVGRPSLASTGIEQGLTAVKRMFEQDETVEGTWMQVDPNAGKDPASLTNNPLQYAIAIWTIPELSFIGYTKESAEKAGFKNVAEGVAYYPNTIRGRVQGLDIGLLKIVFQKPSGRILGVHILGEDACELISYGTALAQSSKTVRQVLGTTFAAVTYHELYTQAATHACAQLDEDSWAEILEGMGFDDGCFVADGVAQGLVEAGMNERSAKEIEVKLTERSCTTADEALEIIKQYRIPGKYRMAQALKEQFKDAGDDAQFRASAEKMFKSMDVDGGGSINKEEMIAGLAKRGLTLSAAVADDLMRAVDADGSGEVDFDEFFIVLKELVGKD